MMVRTFDKMDDAKKQQHLAAAEQFLAQMDGGVNVFQLVG